MKPPSPGTDETIRIGPAASEPLKPPPPRGRLARRLVLGGAAALGVGGLGVYLFLDDSAPPPGPQRLGPRRLVPPLLRTSLRGQEVVYALVRRDEQDASDPAGAPAPRERIELLAFAVADLAPRFTIHIASVPRGGLQDAGLIAEQGATIWLWLGGLGAVSAVDGQILADTAGLAELNPDLAEVFISGARRAWRVADALVVEGGPPPGAWRIDPRDFRASAANLRSPRPLPQIHAGAPHGQGGATAFRIAEARIGADWLGLPAEDAKLAAPIAPRAQGRFLPTAAPPSSVLQQLWRGTVRLASAAPPGWPANFPHRFGQADRLMELATVSGLTGLALAGFLTAGTDAAVELAGPPGLLILHGEGGQPLGLMRVAPNGQVAWRATLPIARLRSVLPGPRTLLLVGWAGAVEDAPDLLVAVTTDDGAMQARSINA